MECHHTMVFTESWRNIDLHWTQCNWKGISLNYHFEWLPLNYWMKFNLMTLDSNFSPNEGIDWFWKTYRIVLDSMTLKRLFTHLWNWLAPIKELNWTQLNIFEKKFHWTMVLAGYQKYLIVINSISMLTDNITKQLYNRIPRNKWYEYTSIALKGYLTYQWWWLVN